MMLHLSSAPLSFISKFENQLLNGFGTYVQSLNWIGNCDDWLPSL